jgi:hypothetical protein
MNNGVELVVNPFENKHMTPLRYNKNQHVDSLSKVLICGVSDTYFILG